MRGWLSRLITPHLLDSQPLTHSTHTQRWVYYYTALPYTIRWGVVIRLKAIVSVCIVEYPGC